MVILDSMWANMFGLSLSPWEKVLRTVLVYAGIAVIIRVLGKRLMAQMNSLDLVVVLLLSNVVQNAIIGDDNTVTGGLLGAVTLVGVNAGLDYLEHAFPALKRLLEGKGDDVVKNGELDERKLAKLGITRSELDHAIRHQGANDLDDVERACIEPGGEIVIDLKRDKQAADYGDLLQAIQELRVHVDRRLDQAGLPPVRDTPESDGRVGAEA